MDSLTFIGTATTLIRLGSFTVLTDPSFLHIAPVLRTVRRGETVELEGASRGGR